MNNMGTPDVSGIQFIDNNEVGNSLVNSINTLTDIELRNQEIQQRRDDKLEEALTIATSGMAARDAEDINNRLQEFIKYTKDVAKQYQGKIPYNKWADIKSRKADIEAMVKKSAYDQAEYGKVVKTMNTTGRSYIDREETELKMKEMFSKPLMERGDFWETVVEHVDPIKILQESVNKHQSGGYKIEGNRIVMSKSNNPEVQIKTIFDTDKKFKRAIEALWQNNPSGYATPEEYAIGTYTPSVARYNESVKAAPGSRISVSSGGGSKSKKEYTYNEQEGIYNFSLSPLRLSNIKDESGRSLGTFTISQLRQNSDGTFTGIGTSDANKHFTYDELKTASEKAAKGVKLPSEVEKAVKFFNEKVTGTTDQEKKSKYEGLLKYRGDDFKDPSRAGESIEIELGPDEVAQVQYELSTWRKIEPSDDVKNAYNNKNKPKSDSRGYMKPKGKGKGADTRGYFSK